MLLLTHQPLATRRGWPLLSMRRNTERCMDGLTWLVRIECRCQLCLNGSGPGDDFYDVDDDGFSRPNKTEGPADIMFRR